MSEKKHVIWSNWGLDVEDGWREAYAEFIEDNHLRLDPEDERGIYEYMLDTNDAYLEDEQANLNVEMPGEIIAIADLGLWNGRPMGYKEIGSRNIGDCLQRMEDYDTWYMDEQGDLRCDSIHHDGTNHVLYRAFREGLEDWQIEDFKEKIYDQKATWENIEEMTCRLGDEICKVYGWDIPEDKSVSQRLAEAAKASEGLNKGDVEPIEKLMD